MIVSSSFKRVVQWIFQIIFFRSSKQKKVEELPEFFFKFSAHDILCTKLIILIENLGGETYFVFFRFLKSEALFLLVERFECSYWYFWGLKYSLENQCTRV